MATVAIVIDAARKIDPTTRRNAPRCCILSSGSVRGPPLETFKLETFKRRRRYPATERQNRRIRTSQITIAERIETPIQDQLEPGGDDDLTTVNSPTGSIVRPPENGAQASQWTISAYVPGPT